MEGQGGALSQSDQSSLPVMTGGIVNAIIADCMAEDCRESPAWHPIHELHRARKRALVCAERGRLTRDSHGGANRVLGGDLVGYVTQITDEGFMLEGFGFATWIYWLDARGAWARDEAPDPCPICGGAG